jgi:hypothetical protein
VRLILPLPGRHFFQGVFYVSPMCAPSALAATPRGREGHFMLGPYQGTFPPAARLSGSATILALLLAPSAIPERQVLRSNSFNLRIMCHPASTSGDPNSPEDYEFIQLKNISANTALDLSGVRFTNGISFNFTGSSITNLMPGASVLIVRNLASFIERYGAAQPVAGAAHRRTTLATHRHAGRQ